MGTLSTCCEHQSWIALFFICLACWQGWVLERIAHACQRTQRYYKSGFSFSGQLRPPIQLKYQQGKSDGAHIMCWKGATLSKFSAVPPITTCTNPPNALRPVLSPILVHYRAKVFRLVHTSLQKYWTNKSYKNKNKKLSRGPDIFVNWRKQAMQRTWN